MAVQSRVFSVGNGVIWGEADVGVVATQAWVDVSYGPQGIELLKAGFTPQEVVDSILAADPDPRGEGWPKEGRQFSVMDAKGNVATYSGPLASDWAGYRMGEYCSAQGNILAGPAVVEGMVAAFEGTEGHLSYRLMAALEAGQAAGGRAGGARIGFSKRAAYQAWPGRVGFGSTVVVPTQALHEPGPGPGGRTAVGARLEEAELPGTRIARGAGSA